VLRLFVPLQTVLRIVERTESMRTTLLSSPLLFRTRSSTVDNDSVGNTPSQNLQDGANKGWQARIRLNRNFRPTQMMTDLIGIYVYLARAGACDSSAGFVCSEPEKCRSVVVQRLVHPSRCVDNESTGTHGSVAISQHHQHTKVAYFRP
jgi:hypothetical protein